MRAAAIAAGVLGAGSALVFALAIAASAMFPNGGTIASNGNQMFCGMGCRVMAQPLGPPIAVPAPVLAVPADSPQPSG
jgi:hypothetical protein